ncbi:MAG: ABC transporter permease [Salinisphaeraceae bacterium]|nr:ABC transporter permease [Salinisphaeraceae bacterium]
MNGYGCWTLFRKEVRRFSKVLGQTVLAPMVTAMLYLLVFSHVMRDRVEVYEGVAYTAFLIPGLMMMSVIQNAFANTSSSLTQSKIMGNVVFLLMPPLSSLEIFLAFVGAALLRATLVALGVYVVALVFIPLPLEAPGILLIMLLLSAATLAVLGMIAGIIADKFEHLAVFQNFVILPASFLSGVFYSIHSLPDFWRELSHYNPFFYMIDGFRYGFFGVGDASPVLSMAVVALSFVVISCVCLMMLHRGYKLRP